jgi:hypothetical protein
VWKPRERSPEREERLNIEPYFLYHCEKIENHKDCNVCSNQKVVGARKGTYFYCKTRINQPACVLGNVSKDITLSRTSKF